MFIIGNEPVGKYGYLATRTFFDIFDLKLEFKQVADSNSGVFIRSFIGEKNAADNRKGQGRIALQIHDGGGIKVTGAISG